MASSRADEFKNDGKTPDHNRGRRREFAVELRKFKKDEQVGDRTWLGGGQGVSAS